MQCQSLIEELSASHSTDLQQRAYELEAVVGLDSHAVESILPFDASCEDLEVILFLSSVSSQILVQIQWLLVFSYFMFNNIPCV